MVVRQWSLNIFSWFVLIEALLLMGALRLPLYSATTGSIIGTVSDKDTEQPLSGVNIVLEETSLTTVTDDNGFFRITNIPPGVYDISASLVGYGPIKTEGINVLMDLQVKTNIELTPTVEEEPLVVIVEERRLTNPTVTQNLYVRTAEDANLAKSQPISLHQVPSIISTTPGVVQDSIGIPHIRGGRDTDIGWMMEGIPVTTPIDNAFGTNLVTVGMSRFEVYTGGYQSEYGSAISGILNEIKRTGSDVRGWGFESTLGSTAHAGIYAEAGNVLPNGLDWYFGNYTWRSDFRRYQARSAVSTDSVVKAVYPTGKKDRLTLLATSGSAEYTLPEIIPPAVPDQNRTNQGYGLIGLTWSHQISPESFWLIRPYYFLSTNNIRALSSPDLDYSSESRSIQRGLQAEFVKSFGEKHQVTTGIWSITGSNHFQRYIPDLALHLTGGDTETAAMFDPYEFNSNVGTRQLALFAQDKIKISNDWIMDAGIRYDRMRFNKQVAPASVESQMSPRIGFVWSKNPRTVVRASFGEFIQFMPTSAMDRQFTNPLWETVYTSDASLRPERAASYEIGWEQQITANTLVRITPFTRLYTNLLDRVLVDPDDPNSPMEYVNAAKARAKGVEVYLERKMGAKTTGWISYTLSHTKSLSTTDPGKWVFVDWDQRHTLDATLAHNCGLMDYTLRLQLGSGLPYTHQTDLQVNTRRLPANLVMTLGARRKLGSGNVSVNIYNLFNSATPTSRAPDGSPLTWIPPRFLSISYSMNM